MVVEDVHGADDATLDVVRLAWRIPALPSVLLLTYRDDEPRDDHPLRRVLGGLASRDVRRLVLRPLSSGAVEELADGHGADAGAVLAATAGNPFFVTEVLANPGSRCRPRSGTRCWPGSAASASPPSGPWSCSPPSPGRPSAGWWRRCSAATRRRWTRPSGAALQPTRARLVPPRAGPPGGRAAAPPRQGSPATGGSWPSSPAARGSSRRG